MSSLVVNDPVSLEEEVALLPLPGLSFKQKQCVNGSPCGSISAPKTHKNLLVVSNKYARVIHATQQGREPIDAANI